jgi:hypothetical protein
MKRDSTASATPTWETRQIERSMARFARSDLRRLAEIAARDRAEFFQRHPRWRRLYAKRVIAVALCQGAALHYVDGKNGVKDFDVWTFYAAHAEAPFPGRRRGKVDYGASKFGRHPADRHLLGRRVDLLGRSLPIALGSDPVEALRDYLNAGSTRSARALAAKAVVLLDPSNLRGRVVWPEEA